jgi:hypothetical protein
MMNVELIGFADFKIERSTLQRANYSICSVLK